MGLILGCKKRKIFMQLLGVYKMVTLYEVMAKWGTQNVGNVYLLNSPEIDVKTLAIKWEPNQNIVYAQQYSVRIYDIRDNIVYLEMF